MWKRIDATGIIGDKVEGDTSAPPTKWWNILWLKWFGWKTVAAYRVLDREALGRGYRVGYKAHDGTCRVLSEVLRIRDFGMRVGREDCTFFAVDLEGKEIRILRQWRCGKDTARAYGFTLL